MRLSHNIGTTLIDYPGKVAFEIYTIGCNYRCPTCHSKSLLTSQEISGEEAITFMKNYKNRDWIDGLVICGGEPTIQGDLVEFLERFKREICLPIKLDTNGSNPDMLRRLRDKKLVDFFAMDIKGPKSLYPVLIGSPQEDFVNRVEESMKVVSSSERYEFRTTMVPIKRGDDVGWMTPEEIRDMASWIVETTETGGHRHYLQKFKARSKEEMVEEKFSLENLPKEMHETPEKILIEAREIVREYIPLCEIR